jgi:hypothetical protein
LYAQVRGYDEQQRALEQAQQADLALRQQQAQAQGLMPGR